MLRVLNRFNYVESVSKNTSEFVSRVQGLAQGLFSFNHARNFDPLYPQLCCANGVAFLLCLVHVYFQNPFHASLWVARNPGSAYT